MKRLDEVGGCTVGILGGLGGCGRGEGTEGGVEGDGEVKRFEEGEGGREEKSRKKA